VQLETCLFDLNNDVPVEVLEYGCMTVGRLLVGWRFVTGSYSICDAATILSEEDR
jgi:uncharacterized protein YuzB (UPF0349 family)